MNFKNAEWVEGVIGRKLSEFHKDCVELICLSQGCGAWDFRKSFDTALWERHSVELNISPRRLSTHLGDGLTMMIIGAYELSIRIHIQPRNMQYLRVRMESMRDKKSQLSIEQAVDAFRNERGSRP